MMFEWIFTVTNGDWDRAEGLVHPSRMNRHHDDVIYASIDMVQYNDYEWSVTIRALGRTREEALTDAKAVFDRDAPNDLKQYLRDRYGDS